MRRRRKRDNVPKLVAAVPWWAWLALAILVWTIGRLMISFAPTSRGTPGQILFAGLFQIAAIFIMYAGPFFCVIYAMVSGVAEVTHRARRNLARRDEPTLGDLTAPHSSQPDAAPDAPSIDTTSWNIRLLQALEWKRLEQLSAAYFRALHFRVAEAAPGPDGGVDLKLYVGDAKSPGVLVQCKAWNSWKVGVKPIRELFGVMAAEHVTEGIFVTTSSFTDEAKAFAQGKNIELIDGADLLSKLRGLPAEDHEQILRLITAGDFTTPTCPSCGVKMVNRIARATGEPFWGCSRYPACRSKIAVRGEGSAA